MRKNLLALGLCLTAFAAAAVTVRTAQARRKDGPIGRFLTVDGVRLHYAEFGSGEPIVLLHGNGSLIQEFLASGLVRRLARSHRVILFDRPGYGFSDRPRGQRWSPAAQADLLQKAVLQLGEERVHLLGHSWGTLVAMEWALRHPANVLSVSALAGYFFPTFRPDVVLAAIPAVPILGDLMRHTIVPLLARLIWPKLLRDLFGPAPTPRRFHQVPRALMLAPRALRASAEESAMMLPAARALQGRYAELMAPLLIIAGEGDRIVDPARQSRRLHERLPGSRLVIIDGAGHLFHHTETAKTAEAIETFTRPRTSLQADAGGTADRHLDKA
jgi:pimeloyl-ACP methyl ester carboxylesterase